MDTVSVPRSSRVALCHAVVDHLARVGGIRALHIKGQALDPMLRTPGRESSDVDVLLHPDGVKAMGKLLVSHGFNPVDTFTTGSPFSHSKTFEHALWGLLDLHRAIPGFAVAPSEAFDALWAERGVSVIAGRPVPVPDPVSQALIVLLHAARNPEQARSSDDVRRVWDEGTAAQRRAVDRRARTLGADLPLAIALGRDLTPFADRRDYDLWMAVVAPAGRVREWRARFRAAGSWSERLQLAAAVGLPNRHSLADRLDRPPTSVDIAREAVRRVRVGAVELAGPMWRRGRRQPG